MAKIMIDPGHAPGNPNHGPTGFYEYAGMWKISNYLKDALERCGLEAGLTRSENECPELSARGKSAKGCDMFLSEHSNAGGGKGCECYYSVRIPGDKGFASALAQAVSGVLGNASRGAKTWHSTKDPNYDYLAVMWYAVSVGCPHVFLCENGFHDDAEDEAQLKSDDKLRDIAEAQAKVICEQLGAAYSGGKAEDNDAGQADTAPDAGADTEWKPGDRVKIRPGVSAFADGTEMASFVKSAVLYIRQIGDGKVLVSTVPEGAVTGWVRTADLVAVDGGEEAIAPAKENTAGNSSADFSVGEPVHIRDGVTAFADGTGMASFIRTALLYVRQIGDGKVLVSTAKEGAVTGWVKTSDLVAADGDTGTAPAPSSSGASSAEELKVGDQVRIRDGVTAFADGVSMASFVRSASLYVRYLGVGKVLVSTEEDGPVTGWVKNEDVVKE